MRLLERLVRISGKTGRDGKSHHLSYLIWFSPCAQGNGSDGDQGAERILYLVSISLKGAGPNTPTPAEFFLPRHPGAVPSSLWLFNPMTVFTTFLTFLPKDPPLLSLPDTQRTSFCYR